MIILADRFEVQDIIKEEREQWVKNLLVMLGVSNDEVDSENSVVLQKYDIQVWNHLDNGDVEIIQNNILVAKWYAPMLIAKYDAENKIYYEVHIDTDSVLNNKINFAEDS